MPRLSPLYLADLPATSLAQISPLLEPWSVRKGDTVFRQGEPVNTLYMIDTGSVRCEVTWPDGRQMIVGFGQAGRCIGDVEVFDGVAALSTAVAHAAATGWTMSSERAFEALAGVPGFAKLMTKALARVGRIHHQMYQYALLKEPHERLAMSLLSMSRNHAEHDKAEHNTIHITQDMLSQVVGLSRQCVSKHLRQWETAGWLSIQYGNIRILDRAAIATVLPQL
ncbi:MAG: Crp/Fnr family transcriptional regulator [Aquabacterium sp.]|nr:Crp/Fnr family transcriptional regulator [Aquabacterium sp.]